MGGGGADEWMGEWVNGSLSFLPGLPLAEMAVSCGSGSPPPVSRDGQLWVSGTERCQGTWNGSQADLAYTQGQLAAEAAPGQSLHLADSACISLGTGILTGDIEVEKADLVRK